jgi:hypothetical protein
MLIGWDSLFQTAIQMLAIFYAVALRVGTMISSCSKPQTESVD